MRGDRGSEFLQGLRRVAAGLAMAGIAMMSMGLPATAGAQDEAAKPPGGTSDAYATTVAYVSQFYPLWFTYNQSRFASHNRLVGPEKVTPIYQIVVAINVDTLYASTFLDLDSQPVVLTVPTTGVTYSVLTLDAYGDVFQGGVQSNAPGTYALTGPNYTGTLPSTVTQIKLPQNFMVIIFRADKSTPEGQNQIAEAEQFRSSIVMQPLCAYTNTTCPSGTSPGGKTLIIPEEAFAIPYKTIADTLITQEPIKFLGQLQEAVASSNTPALSKEAKALSAHFNQVFANKRNLGDCYAGARAAHQLILDRYLNHTGPTNWIHFTNIGAWGKNVVERSSITEFIQYGNGISTAAYYQTFKDKTGAALNGSDGKVYVLTFPAGRLPEAKRFWSVTAYTPQSIELIRNAADKYEVASYDTGLQTNPDGSLSIYMSQEQPAGVATANWLPVTSRPFNIMLRVYGPEGTVSTDHYLPPAVELQPAQ